MATIKFYRVETAAGIGPYRDPDLDIWRIQSRHDVDWQGHPGPYEDAALAPQWAALGSSRDEWLFGFTSRKALKAWFYGAAARAELASKGYAIAVYGIDRKHIRRGTKQAVMYRPEATLVDRIALSQV